MDKITVKAYGKINLGLDVLRKLESGYHEVKMIMQTVNLYDELTFQKSKSGIQITTNQEELPVNEDNLIYKAAKQVMDAYSLSEGVNIHLEKHIPVAAGMAGGSADAAATYEGMKQLFHLDFATEDMQKLGVKIGADIPYCVIGGTALSEGIGEVLTSLPTPPDCYLLIAKPEINVSTAFVYGNLKVQELKEHPDVDGIVRAINDQDLVVMCEKMKNVLESVTVTAYPVIEELKEDMKQAGALTSLMSGSGPTVFGIFDQEEKREAAYQAILEKNITREVYKTEFVNCKQNS